LRRPVSRRTALLAFASALTAFVLGVALAAARYPDQPYDWVYVVISELASRKHNPAGGSWFAFALGLSMLALWPVARYLAQAAVPAPRWPFLALRLAIFCGVAMALERLLFEHASHVIYKSHELLALGLFAGMYAGVLGLYAQQLRQDRRLLTGAVIVAAPLVAIGVTQLALYLDQRDLGWVDHGWRAMGIPFWLSFAFWQWIAVALLWIGIGHLAWTAPASTDR
jgi:hypothetical protein